jgi:outer membrane protein assembly factor BamB
MKRVLVLLQVWCILCISVVARGENWPQWRGPALNGSSTETNLPDALSKTENLVWSVDMPGRGSATPIVLDDRVYVSALDRKTKKLVAICIDRASGMKLWEKPVGEGFKTTGNSDLASPSAIADGKDVYFYFGSGDLVKFDMDGNVAWSRNIQKEFGQFNMQWLYGSSPLLYKGKLYVQVLHRNVPASNWDDPGPNDKLSDSYLLAIDPANGKNLWRHVRPTEAKVESQESYATPMPYDGGGRSELMLVGGDCVTGHDPETGREYWRAGGWNPQYINSWRIVPSVVLAGDLVVACAPKGGPVMAIKVGGARDVTASHMAWSTREFSSDVCVPLYYQGNLYVLDGDRKVITCVEPTTGKKKWSGNLESRPVMRASPTGADGKIYCMNEGGDVWVLSAGEFKVLSKVSLGSEGGPSRASISVSHGQVFVRTGDKLYAFGKKP